MTPVDALVCRHCGRRYDPGDVEYTCPEHEGVDGILDVRYDHDDESMLSNRDDPGPVADLWAFESLLPVAGDPVRLGAGGTPLLEAPELSERVGVETRIKDETGNPTGSSKDRASAVVVTRARERDHAVVACASTGNAAASLAGYAARAGLACRIFVPADLPDAKAVQPRLYDATVLAVEGGYEDAYDRCRAVASERGWYNCNAAMNPYAMEGMRTLGFELAREAPAADWVAMPMGNGCSLAGAWKGFREYERCGRLADPPRMLGVQAAGTAPIYDRFVAENGADRDHAGDADRDDSGDSERDDSGDGERVAGTAADSIDVREPHNAGAACRALRESGGDAVTVTDAAIADAQALLGGTEGVFVEPASAAAVAGVQRAVGAGRIDPDERVVVVATGSGLKDTAGARRTIADDSAGNR